MPEASGDDLSPGEVAVLETIVGGKWAWVALASFDPDQTEGAVASLEARGLIESFIEPLNPVAMPSNSPGGAGVTLTPYGAWSLGVELMQCVNMNGAETERVRWARIKLDADGGRLKEKKSRGVKVPRSFGSLHLPEKAFLGILDGNEGPEYLVDEFNGEAILCFQGEPEMTPDAASPPSSGHVLDFGRLMGGLGSKPAQRGVPIVRDKKKLRGKR
jgi:hypothetical protein